VRKVTDKEVNAVIRLDGPARVERFVKVVADDEVAWGLWADGWALMADDEGRQVFPLWPARQYAELCRTDEWSAYEAREIELSVLLEEFFPKFRERGVGRGPGIVAARRAEELREGSAVWQRPRSTRSVVASRRCRESSLGTVRSFV
jgi:Protein of unknown function (DUF2750)